MSKLSSKQTDEVKSLPMMNLGVELPEFNKTKYPHGGYGKLRDFGWWIHGADIQCAPDEYSRLITFDDLPSRNNSSCVIDVDNLHQPEQSGLNNYYQGVDMELLVFGERDGELRFGIVTEEYGDYNFYLGEGLLAVGLSEADYRPFGEDVDMIFEEIGKDYVQEQVKTILKKDGNISNNLLDLAIFRPNATFVLTANFVYDISNGVNINLFNMSFEQMTTAMKCLLHVAYISQSENYAFVNDTDKTLYEKIVKSSCSELGLDTLWEDFSYTMGILLDSVDSNDLLEINPPQALSELCANILNPPKGDIVYNPFASLGGIAQALPDNEVHGEEPDKFISFLSMGYEYVLDNAGAYYKSSVENINPLSTLRDPLCKHNYIASILPLDFKDKNRAEILKLMIDRLSSNGVLVCVLPISFTTSVVFEQVRKKLLAECNYVEVVSLPTLYSPLTAVELCLLKVTKGTSAYKSVQFMDGTQFYHQQEYSSRKVLKVNSLLENRTLKTDEVVVVGFDNLIGSDLNPARYLLRLPETRNGFEYLPMNNLLSVVKTERNTGDVSSFISLSELHNTPVNLVANVSKRKMRNAQKLTEPAILLSSIGSLKFGKVQNVPVYISDNIVAVKVNEAVATEDYLMHELKADYVQQQFKAFSTGTAVKRIGKKDLMCIQIAVPSIEEQKSIVAEALKNSLSESEAKLQQQFERYRKEIRTRKHAIVQNLSALDSQWNTLNSFRQRNGGNILANDMIGRINPRPATLFFDTIDAYLVTLANQTHHLAEVEYDWGEPTNIEPLNFLRKYIDTHANDRFSCELKGDDAQKMRILMPTRALRQAIDNIVTNALSHGFTQLDRKDYRIHFSAYSEDDKVIILVANNGSALTMQPDMVFTYGASSALNQEYSSATGTKAVHSGIGGHDTREILQAYGASVEIKSIDPDENDGYTVVYRLMFNNNIF